MKSINLIKDDTIMSLTRNKCHTLKDDLIVWENKEIGQHLSYNFKTKTFHNLTYNNLSNIKVINVKYVRCQNVSKCEYMITQLIKEGTNISLNDITYKNLQFAFKNLTLPYKL